MVDSTGKFRNGSHYSSESMELLISIAGYWADHSHSRRFPLLFGLLTMTASTTMYSFGTTPGILLAARAFQGASAAIVGVIGLALIVDTMGPTHAGTAMGWQAVGTFAGAILGPSLGGFVFDQAGHFAVFGMAFALLLVDIVLRFVMIERKIAREWIPDLGQPSDGSLNETSGLLNRDERPSALQGAIAESNISAPSVPAIWTSEVPPVKENIKPNASTSLVLLSKPRLLVALWALLICSILLSSLESVIPIYTSRLFAWSPTQSGLLFIALSLSVLVDPYIGHLADQHGPRVLSLTGFSLGTATYAAFCLVTHDSMASKLLMWGLMAALGFAFGLIQTPNMVEVGLVVDKEEREHPGCFGEGGAMARAYALSNMVYAAGTLVGPVVTAAVMEKGGWGALCVAFLGVNALSAGLVLVLSGGWIGQRRREKGEGARGLEGSV
ncbi:hypothetical protein MMC30_003560 [Trapelia coarctata]|nr:hypothetical protein [Trapelia coarctata]